MEFEKREAMDVKQKARMKWMIDGDENTKFFHGYVNNNNRKNKISGLLINGRWESDVQSIKNEAFRFFSEKSKEKWKSRPKLINPNFLSINMMDAIRLEAPFSYEEVKKVVRECGGDKAPGPDGLAFQLIKVYSSLILNNVMNFVRFFEDRGSIARLCNSSFITLAPIVKDPTLLSEFRLISLIGCMAKIISKILANRLKTPALSRLRLA